MNVKQRKNRKVSIIPLTHQEVGIILDALDIHFNFLGDIIKSELQDNKFLKGDRQLTKRTLDKFEGYYRKPEPSK
jgi:hypothetical protein